MTINVENLYNKNPDFKKYVDVYSKKMGITVHEALEHLIVKEVAKQYGGMDE